MFIKCLFAFVALFSASEAALAVSFPNWHCYFVPSREGGQAPLPLVVRALGTGQFFITNSDGWDLYPNIRFEALGVANRTLNLFEKIRSRNANHICQFDPGYEAPRFNYVTGLGMRSLAGEVCRPLAGVVAVRVDHQTGQNYLSRPGDNESLVGDFDTYAEARAAADVIEHHAFTKLCKLPGSNLVYFRRTL